MRRLLNGTGRVYHEAAGWGSAPVQSGSLTAKALSDRPGVRSGLKADALRGSNPGVLDPPRRGGPPDE